MWCVSGERAEEAARLAVSVSAPVTENAHCDAGTRAGAQPWHELLKAGKNAGRGLADGQDSMPHGTE